MDRRKGKEQPSQRVSCLGPMSRWGPGGDPTETGERLNSDTSDSWTAVEVKKLPVLQREMRGGCRMRVPTAERTEQGVDCLFGCHGVGDFGNHRIPNEIFILNQ